MIADELVWNVRETTHNWYLRYHTAPLWKKNMVEQPTDIPVGEKKYNLRTIDSFYGDDGSHGEMNLMEFIIMIARCDDQTQWTMHWCKLTCINACPALLFHIILQISDTTIWLWFLGLLTTSYMVVLKHIETETKWPTFRRRHCEMHFLEWKYMNFDWCSTEVCS